MEIIIDSNMLRNPVLESFLTASISNVAVICDYVAMEMYKGDPVIACYESTRILCKYPSQVRVLIGTGKAVSVAGDTPFVRKSLIDFDQSRGFPLYCTLVGAVPKHQSTIHQLRDMGLAASQHFDRLRVDAEGLSDIFTEMLANFNGKDIAELKGNEPYSSEFIGKIVDLVFIIAGELRVKHPNKPPPFKEGDDLNSLFLRYSLFVVLLWLKWIRQGQQKQTNAKKLMNDVVDANISAYATLFDGVLSNDTGLNDLYNEGRVILNFLGAN